VVDPAVLHRLTLPDLADLILTTTNRHGSDYMRRLWPALKIEALRVGDLRLLGLLLHPVTTFLVAQACGAPQPARHQAAPPSDAAVALVEAAALDRIRSPPVRRVATTLLLQIESVQRPKVVATLRMNQLCLVGSGSLLFFRTHKVEDPAKKDDEVQEPTPVFPATATRRALAALAADHLVEYGSSCVLVTGTRTAMPEKTYNKAVQSLWLSFGLPAAAVAQMTAHGLRRKGADRFLAAGGTIEDLMALAPWASLSSASHYLPAWWVARFGLPARLGRARPSLD
jgi:hypothetical protein